jgi:hypothetical protein
MKAARINPNRGHLFGMCIGLMFASACLPNPQSVKEERASFDRSGLRSTILFDQLPAGTTPVGAVFGNEAMGKVELVGYRLEPEKPAPGQKVQVTFYWRPLAPLSEEYQVFVHGDALEGTAPRIHGDHYPALGQYSTFLWQVGEVIADPFPLDLPRGYGARRLGLYVGLFKGDYRLPLTQRGVRSGTADNRSLAVEIQFH